MIEQTSMPARGYRGAAVMLDAEPSQLSGLACTVCEAPVRHEILPWTARCGECGTWASSLSLAINSRSSHATTGTEIDREARIAGLERLRRENFRSVLDRIGDLRTLQGSRVLDVGTAHGWFLDEAVARGAAATGVEPEAEVATGPLGRGHDVRVGYFPDALADGEEFDVVTFNDVLEHIPDVRGTLAATASVLKPGGVLSVNIPSAEGLGYRVACVLARAGVSGPYERFWQHGLPSPHRHYFTRDGLAALVADSGFEVRSITPLASLVRDGLWERVHTFRRRSPASVASFAALYAAAPILNRPSQSDIVLLLAQRTGAAPG
jgi:2-polyprenyl-3-methyl-5-hydroxy-6-metoxy-1,4-benzoquinol methylase